MTRAEALKALEDAVREYCDAIEDALAQLDSLPPDDDGGWRMVPVDPTDAMIDAGRAAASAWLDLGHGVDAQREKYRRRYQAMIAAAPSPETRGQR